MSDVKQQYFANLEKQMMKNLQIGMYNYLGLDKAGMKEMDDLLKEQGFVKEVFANSYKVTFEDSMLDQLMEESVKFETLMKKCYEDCNITPEILEQRVSDAMQRFLDDFNEPIYKIVESSANRQGLIQE